MRNADCGMPPREAEENQARDIEQIRAIIAEKNKQYAHRGGEVALAGIENGTVRIAPAGFCWQ